MKARVVVTLKKSVLDPQGQAVTRALGSLGFSEVKDVRLGKIIELDLEAEDPAEAKRRVQDMCEKLLANTGIEEYRWEGVRGCSSRWSSFPAATATTTSTTWPSTSSAAPPVMSGTRTATCAAPT